MYYTAFEFSLPYQDNRDPLETYITWTYNLIYMSMILDVIIYALPLSNRDAYACNHDTLLELTPPVSETDEIYTRNMLKREIL